MGSLVQWETNSFASKSDQVKTIPFTLATSDTTNLSFSHKKNLGYKQSELASGKAARVAALRRLVHSQSLDFH